MILNLCHSKLIKESNEELYASDFLLKPYYQIANSPLFVSIHLIQKWCGASL